MGSSLSLKFIDFVRFPELARSRSKYIGLHTVLAYFLFTFINFHENDVGTSGFIMVLDRISRFSWFAENTWKLMVFHIFSNIIHSKTLPFPIRKWYVLTKPWNIIGGLAKLKMLYVSLCYVDMSIIHSYIEVPVDIHGPCYVWPDL